MATAPVEGLANLRSPFPPNQISKLPKETKAQIDERKANRSSAFKCPVCGGWHHRGAVHLDYVGHAALTDRLLDTDLEWSWEPLALTSEGLPAFDRTGGLWIKLTILGVSRLGYGAADGKSGGDAVKEIIGDALRNAAMRFGAALDLWHKGDLHSDDDGDGAPARAANDGNGHAKAQAEARNAPFPQGPAKNKTELKTLGRELWRQVLGCGDGDELTALLTSHTELTKQLAEALPDWWNGGTKDGEPYDGLATVISKKQTELATAEDDPSWRANPIIGG
jgi:hypothetical protein